MRSTPGTGVRTARTLTRLGVAALAVVVGLGLFAIGRWSVPLDQRPGFAAPTALPIVVSPKAGELALVTPLEAQVRHQTALSVPLPSSAKGFRQVVTAAPLRPGDQVELGDLLGAVNETPVFALRGAVASFRVLHPGDTGVDVRQLAQSLKDLGYLASSTKTLTDDVISATARFLTERGYPGLAADIGKRGVDTRMFAFVGQLPATVIATDVVAGGELRGSDGRTLTLGAGNAELVVAPAQGGVDLQTGATVSANCGSQSFDGTLTSAQTAWLRPARAEDSGPSTGDEAGPATGWVVDVDADISPALGLPCAATATTYQGDTASISVPAAAIFSLADGTTQLHLQTQGSSFTALTVQTGPPAGGWVPLVNPPPELTKDSRLLAGDG